MGNQKFRLCDMMPNACFYKLKDTSKPASAASHYSHHRTKKDSDKKKKQKLQPKAPNTLQKPRETPSRKSYHFTRTNLTPNYEHYPNSTSHSKSSSIDSLFPDHLTASDKTSSSPFWAERLDLAPPPTPSPVERQLRLDRELPTESFEERVSRTSSSNYEPRNIVINIDETKQLAAKIENSEEFITIFDLELRPILIKQKLIDTKKVRSHNSHPSQNQNFETERRQSVSKGIKMRKANLPRISNPRIKSVALSTSSSSSKKSVLAESVAIVKRSENPKEDFKQSMIEMIVEHEIQRSKDLEELLAYYLSLNSEEYHDLIISVFKQIWLQLCNRESRKRIPTGYSIDKY